ncbi:dUTP diphosphatase [Brevibacillus borstelensis]|uniref:dUTP diphosphatase n=1 Tax=Brevibacillus borstelensis TaxID=45462 RepID=UPI003BB03F84
MRNLPVKVKRMHPDAVIPQYATAGAAGFDLVAVEDVVIAPGETVKVRTGLAFELPPGYELQIRPRSGVSAKTKLRVANAPGTVDADFRGEVCVLIENTEEDDDSQDPWTNYLRTVNGSEISDDDQYPFGSYIVRKYDRIAQGIIAEVPRASFIVTDELTETERGEGSFGSTGVS